MNKSNLEKIQEDILNSQGSFNHYLIVFVLAFFLEPSMEIKEISFIPRLTVLSVGVVYLVAVIFKFRNQRSKNQTKKLWIYLVVMVITLISVVRKMIG